MRLLAASTSLSSWPILAPHAQVFQFCTKAETMEVQSPQWGYIVNVPQGETTNLNYSITSDQILYTLRYGWAIPDIYQQSRTTGSNVRINEDIRLFRGEKFLTAMSGRFLRLFRLSEPFSDCRGNP